MVVAIPISMADKLVVEDQVAIEESGAREEESTRREASCPEAGAKAEQMGTEEKAEVAIEIEEIGVATDTTVEITEAAATIMTGIDHKGMIAGQGVIIDEYLQNCEIQLRFISKQSEISK